MLGYPRAKRNGDKLSPLFVDNMDNLFSSIRDSVSRFIVPGSSGLLHILIELSTFLADLST
jgi:hypothetical protein